MMTTTTYVLSSCSIFCFSKSFDHCRSSSSWGLKSSHLDNIIHHFENSFCKISHLINKFSLAAFLRRAIRTFSRNLRVSENLIFVIKISRFNSFNTATKHSMYTLLVCDNIQFNTTISIIVRYSRCRYNFRGFPSHSNMIPIMFRRTKVIYHIYLNQRKHNR